VKTLTVNELIQVSGDEIVEAYGVRNLLFGIFL